MFLQDENGKPMDAKKLMAEQATAEFQAKRRRQREQERERQRKRQERLAAATAARSSASGINNGDCTIAVTTAGSWSFWERSLETNPNCNLEWIGRTFRFRPAGFATKSFISRAQFTNAGAHRKSCGAPFVH